MLRNIASMSALNFYKSVVQFGMNIAIAAFLPPSSYGLIVFTAPFLSLVAMLTDLGLSSAIVRHPGLTSVDAGAGVTLMSSLGLAFTMILALAAKPVETAAHMPGLAPVMAAMSLVIACTVSASVPRAMLERRLSYGLIATVEAVVVFFWAAVALVMAWAHAGVWALVVYNVAGQASRAILFTWLARTEISPNFRWKALGPMLSFGGWVLASNVLTFLSRNSDNILIGAALGASAVGLYGLAYQFMMVPMMAITWPASGVLLATLARLKNEPARMQESVLALVALTSMLTFPAMLFLTFGLAYPVSAFMSTKWQSVVPLVAILAPVGAIQSVAAYGGTVLLSRGHARAQFMASTVNTILLLATFICVLPFGLINFTRAYAVVGTLTALISIGLLLRFGEIQAWALVKSLRQAVIGCALGLAGVWLVTGLRIHDVMTWALACVTFGACILGVYSVSYRQILFNVDRLRGMPQAGPASPTAQPAV